MRRLWILLLAAVLLAGGLPEVPAGAEATELRIAVSGDVVLPGQAVLIFLTVPADGVCNIDVVDSRGGPVAHVVENRPVKAGENALYWNATWNGLAVPQGSWTLRLEMNGQTADTPVTIGRMVPMLIAPAAETDTVKTGRRVKVTFWASEAGTVILSAGEGDNRVRQETPVEAGAGSASLAMPLAPGAYTVEAVLTREDGMSSDPVTFPLTVTETEAAYTPVSPKKEKTEGYVLDGWTVPMDITDTEAVWQALTATVTVLDDGKDRAQVRQVVLRKEPREDSEGVGTITLASQGVHVLERGEKWSKIECYSSSFHDSPILNWNALVQGYVETGLLKEIQPNQEMGFVVDKLTQRLYIFRNGELYSTLLVSTGLSNARQPYNETRSGEYLLVSRVGGFMSDNMYCPRAIRFNDGDLLHEVPYVERNGSQIYSVTEPYLGQKASHGCVRVQRKKNPEGVNQEWIFNNVKLNTKILIWEDWQGRQIPVPEDDAIFWCHPTKTDYYHCSDRCPQLNSRSPKEVTYGEISAEGAKWKMCPACGPTPKKSDLQAVNETYAEGGDHDPVLTEARKDCPKKQKGR
jgi:hypothetical protein